MGRLFLFSPLLFITLAVTGAPASSASGVARPPACGVPSVSRMVEEPPAVEVWTLPLNAGGRHELILSVHREAGRFCYRYAGEVAGPAVAPTIRVRRGERFALRIVNDITAPSKGEHVSSNALPPCKPMTMPSVLTVHHVGYLGHTIDDRSFTMPPLDTNIHLHGFEGPPAQENVFLSTLSTPMHACEYDVTIPRTQPPGTYFYHPHVHMASDDEVGGGLSGVWIVEPDAPQLPRTAEHVIVLRYRVPEHDDFAFAPDPTPIINAAGTHEGSLTPTAQVAYDPFNPPPWPTTFPLKAGSTAMPAGNCNGLFAEPMLTVNNANDPATLDVTAGQTQLLRIVNGTSDSAKVLQLRDAHGEVYPLRVVARDGIPLSGDVANPLARYIAMDTVMLAPSSRVDVLLAPLAGPVTLSSRPFCDGTSFEVEHDLVEMRPVEDRQAQPVTVASLPLRMTDRAPELLIAFARAHPALIRKRAITFTQYAFPKAGKLPVRFAFYITDTTQRNFREHPFWPSYRGSDTMPSNPEITVKRGTIEEWYLINTTLDAHAFHIHQMAFVEENEPGTGPVAADVVFLPLGKPLPNPRNPNYPLVKPSITKVLIDFRDVPRGTFVFHCHMLFHEDHGMMGTIRVV